MNNDEMTPRFWLGNGILAVALILLLNIGTLWDKMGVAAMMLWATLAAAGIYLIMTDKKK